jgi:hypothetical protein
MKDRIKPESGPATAEQEGLAVPIQPGLAQENGHLLVARAGDRVGSLVACA